MALINQNESKLSSFLVRLRSSFFIVLVALAVIIPGKDILFAAMAVISLIGLSELYKVIGVEKSILGITGYMFDILWFVLIRIGRADMGLMLLMAAIMVIMAEYVFATPKYNDSQVATTFFGIVYVGMMLSYIYLTRSLDNGIFLVWLIFVGSWGSDTCAYCTGVLIGKHKLAPRVSPKKSIEGSLGGVIGAALIGLIYAFIVKDHLSAISNPYVAFAVIGAASSVISQIGDLAASAIKRNHDIKDYGKLIPGHGGILDRFDSVIFTAPIVYFLATYVFM